MITNLVIIFKIDRKITINKNSKKTFDLQAFLKPCYLFPLQPFPNSIQEQKHTYFSQKLFLQFYIVSLLTLGARKISVGCCSCEFCRGILEQAQPENFELIKAQIQYRVFEYLRNYVLPLHS